MPRHADEYASLGTRLRWRREGLGLNAAAVAKAAGVSAAYLSLLERGKQREPSLAVLRRLAEALAMDQHALMGATSVDNAAAPIPAGLRTMAAAHHLTDAAVHTLAAINVGGCRPATPDDWLFLWLALRLACRRPEAPERSPNGAAEGSTLAAAVHPGGSSERV